MQRSSFLARAGLALAAACGTASASIIATLTFTTPTGTVASNVAIPVMMTLTLDPSSEPITTDASGNVTSLTAAEIDAHLLPGVAALGESSADANQSNTNESFGCAGTFTSGCTSGPPYDFSFTGGFQFMDNLNLQPGTSTDFLFGTFTPTGGNAPAGTYTYHFASFFIQVFDNTKSDTLRDPGSFGPLHLADVPVGDASNDFTRTVVAVASAPEPATLTMMFGGLAIALVGALRRRSPARN